MSNIYIQEPPTEGKVLLVTTAGDFDIELWSKEAPKACRNFVQLCLENYYNNTVFHRVVKGFIVQGGDPTGTGSGGESIYGKTFKDEFHSRLRFARRGLVAMANAGPNDNASQFFFTLDKCPELQNKNTIFGKVSGNTIYNLSRFEEGIIDKNDRPEFPHKIMSTEVLNNPFPDIVPRQSVKIENEISNEVSKKSKTKGTKNFKLLSFGDEAEEDEEELVTATKEMPNKKNSAHDIAMDPTLSSSVDEFNDRQEEIKRIRNKLKKDTATVESLPKIEEIPSNKENEIMAKPDKEKSRSALKAEIRKLKRELQGKTNEESCPAENVEKVTKSKQSDVLEQYELDKAKYEEEKKKLPKRGSTRESQTLALLQRFANKVKSVNTSELESEQDRKRSREDEEEGILDEDDDESWLSHRLQFEESEPVLAKDASTKDDHWYDLTDPRNAIAKRRREENVAMVKPK